MIILNIWFLTRYSFFGSRYYWFIYQVNIDRLTAHCLCLTHEFQRTECIARSACPTRWLSYRSPAKIHKQNPAKHPRWHNLQGIESILTPETNVFPVSDGARSRQSTSAACPWKLCNSCPLSTSHNAQVPSPLEVRIFGTERQRGRENNDCGSLKIGFFIKHWVYKWIIPTALNMWTEPNKDIKEVQVIVKFEILFVKMYF